jgi:glyoxylase-like metal-dependent hydrolase (beta-lactamase superfamily II)
LTALSQVVALTLLALPWMLAAAPASAQSAAQAAQTRQRVPGDDQLPPGDIATVERQLAADPKVSVPAGTIDTPQLSYDQLEPRPRPMWIEKIRDGLYLIRGPLGPCMNACTPAFPRDGMLHEPGDVAVRVTSDGVILVDDKFAVNVPDIVRLVRTVTPQPIKYLVNSHFHTDHAGGNGEMLARGVILVDQKELRDSYDRNKRSGDSPHIVFDDYGAIYLGGAKVEMFHFGAGHTRGDTTIYFPDLHIIHMGDVVIEGMPHIDYTDGGSAVGMLDEIYAMLKLDWDYAIPGHGRMMTRADVIEYAHKVATMNARMLEIVREGVPRDKAAAALKLDDLGWDHTRSTATFLHNDVGGYYDEMARVLADERAGNERPLLRRLGH